MDNEFYMRRALTLANQAAVRQEVPVGAVVVQNGVIIGEGENSPISHCDPTAHAEIIALRRAAAQVGNYRLPGTTAFVTIEPCIMCLGAMIHARIDHLVFAAREPKAGAIVSNDFILGSRCWNHRFTWQEGIYAAEASALMQDFFRSRRRESRLRRGRPVVEEPPLGEPPLGEPPIRE